MSGQVRWRSAFFLRSLLFCLFCWRFFFLTLFLLVFLAGHQREHCSSMVPREGAVEELLISRSHQQSPKSPDGSCNDPVYSVIQGEA
jgi:hypothetical protein